MPLLNDQIAFLTNSTLIGDHTLDSALSALDGWIGQHAPSLPGYERQAFSASLEAETTNDTYSLVESVLKLHATRLLYRFDRQRATLAPEGDSAYAQARSTFVRALTDSEDGINEARIDIAVANAHHLMSSVEGNRVWLDRALDRLPALAAVDLVALAQQVPALPLPGVGWFKRAGLRLMGFNFERLAQENRDNLAAIARLQVNQIVLLAHLLGTSFETIRERQRAHRAYRTAAHLIARHDGLYRQDADQLLDIAESLQRSEPEAATILAHQARANTDDPGLVARADAILAG